MLVDPGEHGARLEQGQVAAGGIQHRGPEATVGREVERGAGEPRFVDPRTLGRDPGGRERHENQRNRDEDARNPAKFRRSCALLTPRLLRRDTLPGCHV